jgi:hypothetical protein
LIDRIFDKAPIFNIKSSKAFIIETQHIIILRT